MHVTRVDRFREQANPTAMNVLIDDSNSMAKLREAGLVIATLNQIMIPSLYGVNKEERGLLRISLGAFSDGKIHSLTRAPGYYTLQELMSNPLTNDRLGRPGLDEGTALYASMISGIKSARDAALTIQRQSGYNVINAQVIVITDGANCTENRTTPADVARIIRDFGPSVEFKVKLRVSLVYFETGTGLKRSQFEHMTKECGLELSNCHFWADYDKDFGSQEKAFRRLIKLISER